MSQPEMASTESGNAEAVTVPAKPVDPSDVQTVLSASSSRATGGQPQGQAGSPSLPPVWSRYIDSRLKQFCTR